MMTLEKIKQYVAEYYKNEINETNLTLYQYILLREGVK